MKPMKKIYELLKKLESDYKRFKFTIVYFINENLDSQAISVRANFYEKNKPELGLNYSFTRIFPYEDLIDFDEHVFYVFEKALRKEIENLL